MNQNMFCYQCQETAGCTGCTRSGVCGKTPDVAAMQDLLVYVTRGLAAVTTALRAQGKTVSPEVSHLGEQLDRFFNRRQPSGDLESLYHHHQCQLR